MSDSICRLVRTDSGVEYDFDPSKLAFGKLRVLPGGGIKVVPVTYAGGALCFESPSLRAPMGVSCWDSDTGGGGGGRKFSVMLSLSGSGPALADVDAFVRALCAFDAAVAHEVAERVHEILKKDLDAVTVAQLHTPTVRPSDRYAPSMKLALPYAADGSGKAMYQCFDLSAPPMAVVPPLRSMWTISRLAGPASGRYFRWVRSGWRATIPSVSARVLHRSPCSLSRRWQLAPLEKLARTIPDSPISAHVPVCDAGSFAGCWTWTKRSLCASGVGPWRLGWRSGAWDRRSGSRRFRVVQMGAP